jgi:hypothetical protein
MIRQHAAEMREMHYGMIWVHFLNVMLGAWLITSPLVFGSFWQEAFPDAVLRGTQDRGLWEPALRSTALAWNDVASGGLIGALALSPRLSWA